jgi:hypothetical protein
LASILAALYAGVFFQLTTGRMGAFVLYILINSLMMMMAQWPKHVA